MQNLFCEIFVPNFPEVADLQDYLQMINHGEYDTFDALALRQKLEESLGKDEPSAGERKYPDHPATQPTAFHAKDFARKIFGVKAVV